MDKQIIKILGFLALIPTIISLIISIFLLIGFIEKCKQNKIIILGLKGKYVFNGGN